MSELLNDLELKVADLQREITGLQKELSVLSTHSNNSFHETTFITLTRKMVQIAFLEGQIAGLGYACSHIVKGNYEITKIQ